MKLKDPSTMLKQYSFFSQKRKIYKYKPAAAKSLQSCPTLCNPRDGSPPGSPVPGMLQAWTVEWAAISFSNAWKWKVKVKLCPTLSYPMDCSLPGSSAHGIFQARVLEWGAIAFSTGITYRGENVLVKIWVKKAILGRSQTLPTVGVEKLEHPWTFISSDLDSFETVRLCIKVKEIKHIINISDVEHLFMGIVYSMRIQIFLSFRSSHHM